MKKVLKKFFVVVFATVACASVILMCAENADGSINLPWSLGWLAALILSAKILEKLGVFGREVKDLASYIKEDKKKEEAK